MTSPSSLRRTMLLAVCGVLCKTVVAAGDDLGSMSLTELMNEPVTSVSKKQTKLSDAAAAITVITQEDLRRSGVTSLPDALRLVPGIDVARISSNEWAVTARGFNGLYANKLLVLVDGRTVYTPTSAGVYWNAQDLMLEDIDRIEVVRGPGATLWGSNAVNGVINITTKQSRDTQGLLVSALADSEAGAQYAARYGGHVGGVSYRAYMKHLDQDGLSDPTHTVDTGGWHTTRGGFRMDWDSLRNDSITVQADAYGGRALNYARTVSLMPVASGAAIYGEDNSGENVLGRWAHTFANNSVFTVQTYVDHAVQGDGASVEERTTYDIDIQHQLTWGINDIVWGTGYRVSQVDDDSHSFVLTWNPADRNIKLFNFFAQDDVYLVPDRLRATLGAKFEENSLVPNSIEPNVRLMFTPVEHQAIWAAVSRATRTPALFELEGRANGGAFQTAPNAPPVLLSALPNLTLRSEDVLAYEIGYRYSPANRIAIDVAAFFNDYTHVIGYAPVGSTFEDDPGPPHVLLYAMQSNGGDVQTYGTEATVHWQASTILKITASYDWLHINEKNSPASALGSAKQHAQLRAYLDLPHQLEFNSALYYVSRVDDPVGETIERIPAYVRADVGLTWRPRAGVSVGVWGRNLLQHDHLEFANFDQIPLTEVPRSVLGKITWSY